MRPVFSAAIFAAAILPTAAGAQEVDFRGEIDVETAIEFETGRVQKSDLVIEPQVEIDFGALGDFTAIGRLRADPVDELEPGRPVTEDQVRGPLSRRLFIGEAGDVALREVYLDRFAGDAFLRLGKQQIVWGQADGLRVLDVVNPMHYREFILPDFEDRRIPLWTALVEAPIGAATAQFVWIPDHTYDQAPSGDAPYTPRSPLVAPAPGPALTSGRAPALRDADKPSDPIRDDDVGARLTAFVDGWDLSLNYLFHHRDEAALRRERLAGGGVAYTPTYYRSHLIGGGASNAFGDVTLRTEIGYSTERRFITNAPADADGLYETDELAYVLGLDYQLDSDLIVSTQLFQSWIDEPPAGATRSALSSTATLRVAQELMNDTVTLEGLAIQSLDDADGLLQLEARYRLRTALTLRAGVDLFYGDEDGLYGQFDERDRVTVGLNVGF